MEKSCTIQDVFERFYLSYEKRNSPPAHHRKTAYHIMNCKTGAFGVNISVCEDCGCISIHNNSCRSRCCPMCQEFPKEKWIDAQKENVLDAPLSLIHIQMCIRDRAKSAADFTNTKRYKSIENILSDSDTLFITVPDGQISKVWDYMKNLDIKNKNLILPYWKQRRWMVILLTCCQKSRKLNNDIYNKSKR